MRTLSRKRREKIMTHLAKFGSIDQTRDADYFIRFLDEATAQPSLQAYKQRLTDLLALQPGSRVLDVGCGTGDDARVMVRLVLPGGQVVGIDNSEAMIAEAQRRAAAESLAIDYRLANAMQLPFADNAFDAARADRSLMHVPDARQVLAEMSRVTIPGGRVGVFEVDFETLTVDADDRLLARKISHTWCDGFKNGWLGRRMPCLFAELGLQEIAVTPYVMILTPGMLLPLLGGPTTERAVQAGVITPEEAKAWLAHLDDLQRTGRFFSTMTGYLVAGRKS
jgi:ubiquinone/menaquinone biosynthesis C-methylase UbiE